MLRGGVTVVSVATRMEALKLALPPVPQALATYVPAVITGSLCFTSGQLSVIDGVPVYTGLLGQNVDLDQGYHAARVAALNALSAAQAVAGGLANLDRIVKLTVFVQSASDFHQQAKVANGASDLFEALFDDKGRHARSAVGVSALPLNVPVEVECIFSLKGSLHD